MPVSKVSVLERVDCIVLLFLKTCVHISVFGYSDV